MTEERRVYATDRLTQNQISALIYICGIESGAKATLPKKRTLDSLMSRGMVVVRDTGLDIAGKGLSTMAKIVAPGSPTGQRILMELIGASPLVVHLESWEYWALVGAAHKSGMIRQKLEPEGGFGSNMVKVTLSWATPKDTKTTPLSTSPSET